MHSFVCVYLWVCVCPLSVCPIYYSGVSRCRAEPIYQHWSGGDETRNGIIKPSLTCWAFVCVYVYIWVCVYMCVYVWISVCVSEGNMVKG